MLVSQKMLQKKTEKLIALIDENFQKETRNTQTGEKQQRKTLTITPGHAGWPLIKKDVVQALQNTSNLQWIVVPFFVKIESKEHLEFMLATKNVIDCWEVWCSLIQVQYSAFRRGIFTPYQLWVFQHILNVSSDLKAGLEKLTSEPIVLPEKSFIADYQIITQSHKIKESNTLITEKGLNDDIKL